MSEEEQFIHVVADPHSEEFRARWGTRVGDQTEAGCSKEQSSDNRTTAGLTLAQQQA